MEVDKREFFREVTIRICGSLDIEKALQDCFRYMGAFVPLTSMSLVLYDPDMNIAHIIASAGGKFESRFGKTVVLPSEGVEFRAARWASMGPVEIINRPDLNPEMKHVFRQLGLDIDVSMIDVRLELEGNRIGVLSVMTAGMNRYREEHGDLLQSLHEPFAIAMANALRYQEILRFRDMLADDNKYFQRQLLDLSGREIIGAEFGLKEVMKAVGQVAPLESPVLLYGETGVGKEVIANAIHYSSPRKEGPFIKVNCGAIPETLMDSELFGHEKGAFTGAIAQKRGRFERADKGTILLDEIGELPLQAQVRLLNVLQNREIERVGGARTIPLDIRIISATHRNLDDMVRAGQFREDLWFRLNVFPVIIPPLRQRKEDIPALVHHFIEQKSMELRIGDKLMLAPGSMERLYGYDWPGNVRELQNIVERALIQSRNGVLRFDTLVAPHYETDNSPSTEKRGDILTLDELNTLHIRKTLNITRGRINGPGGAAALLRIHPNTLRKRMDKLKIPYKRGE